MNVTLFVRTSVADRHLSRLGAGAHGRCAAGVANGNVGRMESVFQGRKEGRCAWVSATFPLMKRSFSAQEIHVIHTFESDFYGSELRAIVCEYIRPERNFGSLDELVAAIKSDIALAQERTAQVDEYCKLKVRNIGTETETNFIIFFFH
jgi:hypothetical protein